MKCRSCGKQVRTTKIAFVLAPGGLKGGRVCQGCFAGGVTLVAPKLAPVKSACAEPKSEREALAPYVRMLRSQLRMLQAAEAVGTVTRIPVPETQGRIEGMEAALSLLQRGLP